MADLKNDMQQEQVADKNVQNKTKEVKFNKDSGPKWVQTFIFKKNVISSYTNKNGKEMSVVGIGKNRITTIPSSWLMGYAMEMNDPIKNFRKAKEGEKQHFAKMVYPVDQEMNYSIKQEDQSFETGKLSPKEVK